MSGKPIKIAVPAEANYMYCPKCNTVLPGRFRAYSLFSFNNDNSNFYQKYIEYDDTGCEKDIKCECRICGNSAIPILSDKCADIVKSLSTNGFPIVSVNDKADLRINGDITVCIDKPLFVRFKIPQLSGIEHPVKIANEFDNGFTVEREYDDVWELKYTGDPCITGSFIALKIKQSINAVRAKEWYETECRDYIHSMKLKLDSMRDKNDSKVYRVIMSYPMLYKRDDSNLFAGIVIEDHSFIRFIGEDKSFPDGVEAVLRSTGDIEIELSKDFDVDATGKWLSSILERMDKYESNN